MIWLGNGGLFLLGLYFHLYSLEYGIQSAVLEINLWNNLQHMSTMKYFLKEKWLWAEYCVYFMERKVNNKDYIPKVTKDEREEKKKIAIEMYKNWNTYREIWKSFNPPISYQTAYNYIKKNIWKN